MLMNWPTMKVRLHMFNDLRVKQNIGKLNRVLKRDVPMLKRKLYALQSYIAAIKYMICLPEIVIIVDQEIEYMAFHECAIFGSLTICLIDTNCNQTL